MQQFLAQTGSSISAGTSPPASPQPRLRQQQAPRKERDPQNKEKEAPPAAMADEHQDLTRAFAGLGGLGVDETALVSALGRWRRQPEKRALFRRGFPGFFSASAGAAAGIERCEDEYLLHLKAEFARFKDAAVLWAMHPWERDARWAHHVLHKAHPPHILVEVACTRAADDLLGARRAYQALYHRSLEEDVAYRVRDANASLLVGLVSAYRYEGARVSEDLATEEAKALAAAVRAAPAAAKLVQNEQVVRVLATRSKPQLRATFRIYMELHGKPLEEVVNKQTFPDRILVAEYIVNPNPNSFNALMIPLLFAPATDQDLAAEPCLREAVKCLDSPPKYFSEVISRAFSDDADRQAKAALTRVLVSRADTDMEDIKDAYARQYGAKLADAVAKNTHGHYKDALLAIIGK